MTIPILFLRLEGPMQSWGERAHWDYRDSGLFPTKSGIVGLLSCALGYQRGDEAISRICENTRIAVRADKPGFLMTDYHTVQGPKGIIINAEGKKRPGSGTIVTPRQYLQDASFLVAITADKSLLERFADALAEPRWITYLGRKCCPATKPVYIGINENFESLETAIKNVSLAKGSCANPLCEIEDEEGIVYRQDIISSGTERAYLQRKIRKVPAIVDEKGEEQHVSVMP